VRARDLFDASRAAVRELVQLTTGDQPELPSDYRPSGHLVLAAKPKHFAELEKESEVLSKVLRHETQLVPRQRLGEELGASVPYYGARVDPEAGCLNPAKLLWSLAAAAQRAGTTLVEEVEVQSLRREAGRFMVRTSKGTLGAGDVVVATGGYGNPVLPALRRRFVPLASTLIATAPLGQSVARALIPRDRVVTDTRHRLTWFRITPDTRMLFGGWEHYRTATKVERIRNLTEAMCDHFPRLLGTDVDYHWTGTVAMTLDRLPHAGERDGVHFALGCNGQGLALATYLGARIADHIAGRGDLEPFRSLGFHAVPLNFGRPWFLPMLGAYYKLRDSMK
jgi:glycine/D-amino acid oxidase-like deaminating enzyme